MQQISQKKIDSTANMLIGASVAIVFIAIATIASELYVPFKNWLAGVFFHHWIGKGALAMIVFIVVSLLSNKHQAQVSELAKLSSTLFWVSLLSALAVAGFFGYEVFLK